MESKVLQEELDSLLNERSEISRDLTLAKAAGQLSIALHLRESLCHYDRWIKDKREEMEQPVT
jgi:hypothetical protein